MGITVGFDSLNCGINAPGETTTQSGRFSAAVGNLTATIAGDANHVFSLVSVTVYDIIAGASLHRGETFTAPRSRSPTALRRWRW